jgi:TonB family protein
MRFGVFLFLLLIPASACAQATTAATSASPKSQDCGEFYPPGAVRAHPQGTTTLAILTTAQGSVTNVAVKSSSGYASLDDAAMKCVQQLVYTPATRNGAPTEETKDVNLKWSLDDSQPPLFFYTILAAAQNCVRKTRPSSDALASATRMTVATIQFYRSAPPDVELIASRGNADLDRLVIQCLTALPATIAGNPPIKLGLTIPFSWKTDTAASSPMASPASAGTATISTPK